MDKDSFPTWNPETLHRGSGMQAYKVKDGDSLKSLAEGVGLTWQELALLNWGTDEPDKINWYLEHHVGCTKKSDEHNYAFTSGDDPGIVWLPQRLPAHQGRVRRGVVFVSRYPIS